MTNVDVFDYDIVCSIDESGNISQYTGKYAIQSSIINWLTSFKGDIRNNPTRGGYVTSNLYKPMNEENKKNLEYSIIDGFYQDYYPQVKIEKLEVVANYDLKQWEIYLSVYSYLVKESTDISLTLKNFV